MTDITQIIDRWQQRELTDLQAIKEIIAVHKQENAMSVSKLRELHEAATPGPWSPVEATIYFPQIRGGFCIQECPQPYENVQLIAYLRNHAADFIALIDSANEAKTEMKKMEVKIEGEWGMGKSLEELERDIELSDELVALRAALKPFED